jgi:hypothetical protein
MKCTNVQCDGLRVALGLAILATFLYFYCVIRNITRVKKINPNSRYVNLSLG